MSESQTTTQRTQPTYFPGTEDAIKNAVGDLSRVYEQGPYFYSGSTVVPFSQQTERGLGAMENLARRNMNGRGMADDLKGILQSGGFNPQQRDAMSGVQGLTQNDMLKQLLGSGFTSGQSQTLGNLSSNVNRNNDIMQSIIDGGGFTSAQNKAFGALQDTVYNNNAAFQDLFNRGGLTDQQKRSLGQMEGSANLFSSMVNPIIANQGLTADQLAVADKYRTDMNASEDIFANPYYAQVMQNALDKANAATSATSAAMGRYGGSADQALKTREAMKIAGEMNYNEWQNNLARKNQAASNLAGLSQTGVSNMSGLSQAQQGILQGILQGAQLGTNNMLNLNSAQQAGLRGVMDAGQMGVNNIATLSQLQRAGLGDVFNMQQTGVGNSLNALGAAQGLNSTLFNMGGSGLDAMGKAYQTSQLPAQTMLGAGSQYEDLLRRQIQDQVRVYDAQNPWNYINQYIGSLTGQGLMGQNTVTEAPGPSPLLQGVGALGLLGSFL